MQRQWGFGLCVLAFVGAARDAASENAAQTPQATFTSRGTAGSSAIALASFNGGLLALVADEDDSAIHVFEAKPPKEIAVAKVPGVPSQVIVTKTGQVAVSLRDKGQVALLEAKGND